MCDTNIAIIILQNESCDQWKIKPCKILSESNNSVFLDLLIYKRSVFFSKLQTDWSMCIKVKWYIFLLLRNFLIKISIRWMNKCDILLFKLQISYTF